MGRTRRRAAALRSAPARTTRPHHLRALSRHAGRQADPCTPVAHHGNAQPPEPSPPRRNLQSRISTPCLRVGGSRPSRGGTRGGRVEPKGAAMTEIMFIVSLILIARILK
jgi:hypothetical protein